MSDQTPDQNLHLPSLVIKNFRGIDELTIPRLGRVTLLTGKNGVGKTTVLDAVRVWADRGISEVFDTMLIDRGDWLAIAENGQMRIVPDRMGLFTDREDYKKALISIGPSDDPSATLIIKEGVAPWDPYAPIERQGSYKSSVALERQFGTYDPVSPVQPIVLLSLPEIVDCEILGPNGPADDTIEQYWNEVALSHHEDRAMEALNLITSSRVERVAMISAAGQAGLVYRRRMMAKVEGHTNPVPLRSLGDGAFRTFAVALALANSKDGFLLIDEAENGIHHSIQAKFWNMVLQTAERNNVQVIATTHSWDCVVGFAQAANELEDVEGLLVRLERPPAGLRPITYDESRLASVTKYDIEVR